ncbi:MAG: tRNA (adenosine(37)-N6)-threonylcarbamoyltransferase complex dimerization subunit type 1 TsaB [Vicinamibacterales bacterium]|jgi:tRNA threonylcarbamoyladenosine biosynthesis protein TsaB|nr:tRNA (adenosine(37)-N6)-threonylcarbamoyltransferase complex dimerization subunit type 1 TsaB [Vicinamibacterales bacterium]
MRVLSLDTTGVPGSAALAEAGRPLRLSAPSDTRPFGQRLPGWLLDLLHESGASPAGVDLFVVGAGPGSLTGLRVGIATMQGLALATGRPLLAVSALEALAHSALDRTAVAGGAVIAAWTNARRGEVFAQAFSARPGEGLSPICEPTVGAAADVAASWRTTLAGRPLVVVGDAATGSEAVWGALDVPSVATLPAVPLAGPMARIGEARARRGEASPPHAVRPLYVRRPDAEVARERAAAARASHGP